MPETLTEQTDFFEDYDVYIPSLKKTFKQPFLTIEQYKQILSNSYALPVLNIGFNLAINSIILSNTSQFNNQISEFDKYILVLYYRYYNISKKYKDVLLTNKLKECENKQHPDPLYIDTDVFKIKCNIPNLILESEYLNFVVKNFQFTGNNVVDVLLVSEIAKFIETLTVNQTNIDLNVPFEERIKIISTLPTSISIKIIKYIDSFKQNINNLYTLNNTIKLPYNVSLFVE
jgi:hypothetical protein